MKTSMDHAQICQFVLKNSDNCVGIVLYDTKDYDDLSIDEDNIKHASFEAFMKKNFNGSSVETFQMNFFDFVELFKD